MRRLWVMENTTRDGSRPRSHQVARQRAQQASRGSKETALLAYSEALAATEYLEARKGRTALLQILELLGERYTMNDALKKVIGLDYQELQTAWEADLERYRPPDR